MHHVRETYRANFYYPALRNNLGPRPLQTSSAYQLPTPTAFESAAFSHWSQQGGMSHPTTRCRSPSGGRCRYEWKGNRKGNGHTHATFTSPESQLYGMLSHRFMRFDKAVVRGLNASIRCGVIDHFQEWN